ncbi:MAG: glycosyltransferase family 39 protein [Anaerolineae bacterium]
MNKRAEGLLLGGIVALAGLLRILGLGRMGFEIDEAYSVRLASLGIVDIVRGTAAGQHPPLYYLLLHLWMQAAGQSLFAVRLASALVGWLTVPLLYLIGRRFGPQAGLLAAGLLAISPAHIWYSQIARMYALLVLLGTVSTWLAWRWWTDGEARSRKRLLLYAGITLAALYTHYFALFLIALHNLAGLGLALFQNRPRWRRLAGQWLAIQALIVIGFLPWLPIMLSQTTDHLMTWIPPLSWPVVRSSWLYLLFGQEWQGTGYDRGRAWLGLGLLIAALWPGRPSSDRLLRTDRGWAVLWFWVPVVLILLAAVYRPIYQNKQLLIVLPPLLLLLTMGLLRIRPRLGRGVVLVALIALSGLSLYSQYAYPQRQQWDDLAAYLNTHARPGDLLYLNAAASSLALDCYLKVNLDRAGYPVEYDLVRGGWVGEDATPEGVDRQLRPLADRHPRIWLVEFSPGFWDPEGLILTWLRGHYREQEYLRFYPATLRLFSKES